MLIKNSFLEKKIKIIYLSTLILGFLVLALLAILGNSERMGYISEFAPFNAVEINDNIIDKDLTSNTYEYRMRIKYNSKVFRNSDIFGVYPQSIELPDYIENIKWDGKGSPFGKLTSSKELASDYAIDIGYKLKLKYGIILYFVLWILFTPLIIFAFIYINKKYKINNDLVKDTYSNVSNQIFDGFSNIRLLYIIPIVFYPILILLNQLLNLPYYFAWDSSLTYATDSLLINGGISPNHLFHPDIGALWIEKFFVFPLAKILGIISISTIQEFQKSLNPYLNFVEIVEFLILIRSSYVYIACSFVYIFIIKLFDDVLKKLTFMPLCIFLISCFLFSYDSIFGAITMMTVRVYGGIRYELAGFIWWSFALIAMLYAVRTNKKRYIVAMGVFAGWAFLSKIVLLPNIILVVMLFYVLHLMYNNNKDKILCSNISERKLSLKISCLLLSIVIISIMAALVKRPRLNSAFLGHIESTGHLLISMSIFPILLSFIVIVSLLFLKHKDKFNYLSFYLYRLIIFIFSCYIPIIIILFQKNGLEIFSSVYIFSFGLGQSITNVGYSGVGSRINTQFILYFIFTVASILFYIYSYKKNKKLLPLCAVIIMFGAITLLNKISLRSIESNLQFYSIYISISVLILILYNHFKNKNITKYIFIIFIVLISLIQINRVLETRKTLDAVSMMPRSEIKSSYVFNTSYWYTFSYGGNAIVYTHTLAEVYKNEKNWNKAFYWSRDIANVKDLLNRIEGTANNVENTSIIFPESKLSDNGDVLKQASDELQGAISIPVTTGSVYPRFDYSFYLVSSKLLEDIDELLELTDLLFETTKHTKLYVYEFIKPNPNEWKYNWMYNVTKDKGVEYVLITDSFVRENMFIK